MKKLLGATTITLALASSAHASALLYGEVQFNQATNLYTYNYAIQNDTGVNIFDVAIMVGNRALGTMPDNAIQPLVPIYAAPENWYMFGSFSGTIVYPPYNMSGGFYEFDGPNGNVIAPHTSAFGFSFTTRFAPTLDNGLNDYFLYGSGGEAGTGGVIAYGNVVVPNGADWDMYVPPPYNPPPYPIYGAVPESSTWAMLIIGFAGVTLLARHRKRRPARRYVALVETGLGM